MNWNSRYTVDSDLVIPPSLRAFCYRLSVSQQPPLGRQRRLTFFGRWPATLSRPQLPYIPTPSHLPTPNSIHRLRQIKSSTGRISPALLVASKASLYTPSASVLLSFLNLDFLVSYLSSFGYAFRRSGPTLIYLFACITFSHVRVGCCLCLDFNFF